MSKYLFLLGSLLLTTLLSHAQQDSIAVEKAKFYINKTMKVCGTITDARLKDVAKNEPDVLFTGDDYNHRTMALIFPPDVLKRFSYNPNLKMINHSFCATGKIIMYDGEPGMYIKNENQLNVAE